MGWVVRAGLFALTLVTLCCAPALAANDADEVYESSSEALEALQVETRPESGGVSVNEVISQFFPEVEEDEGTYPASEFIEHDFLLRRQGPAKGTYGGRIFTKYSKDNISGVEKWEKEFELDLAYKDVTSYMRFGDVNVFAGNKDPFRWEKANVRYKHRRGEVTLGSYGALFGRGLTLNMFEERFLEFDNEVEGIKAVQELGGGDLTALWGKRKLRTQRHASEISALRYQRQLGDSVEVGLHTAKIETPPQVPSDPTVKEMMDYELIGGDIKLTAGDFRGYYETVRLKRGEEQRFGDSVFDFEGQDGRGHYATASYSIPGFSFSGEYKDYAGILQPFSALPPIRRWWEKAQADATDDVGYGFDLNLSPSGDGSSWAAHYAQDNSHEGKRPYTESFIIYNSPSQQDLTYVAEYWRVFNETTHHSVKRMTLSQILDEDWTVSSFLEHDKISGDTFAFTDYILEGELNYGSKFNLIYFFEATTADTADNPDKWKLWEVKWMPTEDQEVHLLWGARRAGFVCSGGVCREEPAFDGVRVDYLFRF